jgi:hypothetical protein
LTFNLMRLQDVYAVSLAPKKAPIKIKQTIINHRRGSSDGIKQPHSIHKHKRLRVGIITYEKH